MGTGARMGLLHRESPPSPPPRQRGGEVVAASSCSERRARGILLSEQAALLLGRAGRTPRTWLASRPQCSLPFTFPHAQNRAPSKFEFALCLV